MEPEKKFLIRVRLIIIRKNKILLSFAGNDKFYFFPGGKVEFGETLKQTAIREIQEECNASFTFNRPLYIRDYFEEPHIHNLEVYILGEIDRLKKVKDKEHPDHHQEWVKLEDLPNIDVRPKQLVSILFQDYSTGFSGTIRYLGIIK